MRNKIFQAFNWKLQAIIENVPRLSEQGFNMIQVSPLQEHKEPSNSAWFLTYQVTNYKIGNRLGTKDELINLCKEAHKYNIKIIIDCVFNHVANAGSIEQNLDLVPSKEVDPKILNRQDFFHEAIRIKDYENRYECTQFCFGLPGLNTANHDLQDMHIDYLKELLKAGVDGFRLDAARHIELPDDAWCGSDYWDRVLGSLENKDKLFIYGECIYSNSGLIERYSKYMIVGTNIECYTAPEKLVRWPFSHDDDLTFNIGKSKSRETLINEWEHMLKIYPKTHMLFYPCDSDVWMDKRIREINQSYS